MYLCLIPCIITRIPTNKFNYAIMEITIYIYAFSLELDKGY